MTVMREPAAARPGMFARPEAAAGPGPAAASTGTATCWLCGTRQSTSLMVADGGPACADVRWYCADAEHCTWRWTSQGK